jgi:hypothetical protein
MMRGTSRGSFLTSTMSPAWTANLCPGSDRDAHVRGDERRRIVHSVADHRDSLSAGLELLDRLCLVLGKNLRKHGVDSKFSRDCVGNRPGIAGEHRDLDLSLMELLHGLPGLGANGIGDGSMLG